MRVAPGLPGVGEARALLFRLPCTLNIVDAFLETDIAYPSRPRWSWLVSLSCRYGRKHSRAVPARTYNLDLGIDSIDFRVRHGCAAAMGTIPHHEEPWMGRCGDGSDAGKSDIQSVDL
jgi:hypothetical protein